jgi:mRNA interferase YafQ
LPLEILQSSRFKRDIKRLQKQGKKLADLRTIIHALVEKQPLHPKLRDHKLMGDWEDYRDCHVGPDWLLIYKVKARQLYLARTGSHSEIFK